METVNGDCTKTDKVLKHRENETHMFEQTNLNIEREKTRLHILR